MMFSSFCNWLKSKTGTPFGGTPHFASASRSRRDRLHLEPGCRPHTFWFLLIIVHLFFTLLPAGVFAQTPEETYKHYTREGCINRITELLQDERKLYRHVQFGDDELLPGGASVDGVLETDTSVTEDLVPYLVLNYHALDCRLRALCDSVEGSLGHGERGTIRPHRPIGCSRFFLARGRWWSPQRRGIGFMDEVIPECALQALEPADTSVSIVTGSLDAPPAQCRKWAASLLEEERQMLYLLVAQDSTHRGTQRTVGLMQNVLWTVRFAFLEPLREMTELFGNIVHPIPCFLTQCD